jgi:predicted transcriptional regulator
MSEGQISRKSPADLVGDWPRRPSPNVAVEIAREIVLHLRAAADQHSVQALAEQLGVSEDTLTSVLDGHAWPPIVLVSRAEQLLGVRLIPRL